MYPKKNFEIKLGVDINQFQYLHPNLLILFGAFLNRANQYNMPVKVTSLMEDVSYRVHKTHAQGRALDISSHRWQRVYIDEIVKELNNEYRSIAAVSAKTLIPQAVVFHEVVRDGVSYGEHFHLQVKP